MIGKLYLYESDSFDPYLNLAREEQLLLTLPDCSAILYLWQNENTVVIGRNQAARRECDIAALSAGGGHLARRLSGGGAVYHDTGNLNFTFFLHEGDYDVRRQCRVLQSAARALGVEAELSGRNDLTVGGRKFSGNAYYQSGDRRYHHGTLMLSVDVDKLSKYLLVSDEKLRGKGVASVRARVVNLCDINPSITVSRMKAALTAAFAAEYGAPLSPLPAPDEEAVRILRTKYASDAWLLGREEAYDRAIEKRFPWGAMRLEMTVRDGVICAARAYSDAMDETLAPRFASALRGAPLGSAHQRVDSPDLSDWLKEALT